MSRGLSSSQKAVLAALEGHDRRRVVELAKATGYTFQTVYSACNSLRQRGTVERAARGEYRLADAPNASPAQDNGDSAVTRLASLRRGEPGAPVDETALVNLHRQVVALARYYERRGAKIATSLHLARLHLERAIEDCHMPGGAL